MTDLLDGLTVSRETEERLRQLNALLEKWNPAINLVSKSTMADAWRRHILDSAQLYSLAGPDGRWVDLGSGGGFPGLVIAALRFEYGAEPVVLVEADQRKATFLREAARHIGVAVDVRAERIEAVPPLRADVLSARALAPLDTLCGFVQRHMAENGVALFPKGQNWESEVAEARQNWDFQLEVRPSAVEPVSVVLVMKAISHV